jgi:hypothetical protein
VTTKPKSKPLPTPKTEPQTVVKPKTVVEPPPAPDTKAPTVTITSAPPASAATDSAEVAFKANETGVTFSCSLDAAVATACTSPVALTGLSPGQHTFSVRGTDKAKNAGKPVSVTWTYTPPDTTPPTVTVSSAPPATTTDGSATFQFASSEPGSSFACSLDGGAFAACTSAASYTSLAVGSHAFSVTATDAAGNTSQAATHNWTIVTPLPDLLISSFTKNTITITNRGSASAGPSTLTITLIGTFTVPKLDPGSSQTFSWSICRVGTYSAIVDRTNAVAESDETNNRASRVNTCP